MGRWVLVMGLAASCVAFAKDAFLSARGERAVEPPLKGAVTSIEERLGVPTFYWAEPTSRPRTAVDAASAARQHLLAHAAMYRLSATRVAQAVVSDTHDTGQGAVIVSFQQRLGGVRVFRDEVHVVMSRDLGLVAISGALTPEVSPRDDFMLTAPSAVGAAWRDATGSLRDVPPSEVRDDAGFVVWSWRDGSARARPVWFPLVDGVAAGFHVELEWSGGASAFVISARDGEVLFDKSLVASHSYAVWADATTKLPWPSPLGPLALPHDASLALPVLPQVQVSLENAGLSTNDPWLAPGAAETRGNNVFAYVDWDYPDGLTPGVDSIGRTTAPGEFHYTFNPQLFAGANETQKQVGVTQLFYVTNFLHDWFYDAGFDERARNAQLNNFGRGGAANDVLLAEALDWSGRNNANMLTPSDGRSPRMQMYDWVRFNVLDSAMDASIIAHEYGHFISNRLIGDAVGISNHQGYGLGEGWGDFHSSLLLATEADTQAPSNANWAGAFGVATYSSEQPRFGIRRFPMSSDFAINPLTFRHIQRGAPLPTSAPANWNTAPNHQEHNTGEVWAVMLWDCYVTLLRDPRFTFAEAQGRMKRYLVAAYKATPVMPTFIEARDALLSVAAANDSDDYLAFWTAFARRGIGGGASGPARDNPHNIAVTESYQVLNSVRLVSVSVHETQPSCDDDGVLDADEDGEVRVEVRNLGLTPLTAGVATVTVTATPAGVSFPSGSTIDVPALAPSQVETVVVPVRVARLLGPRPIELTVTAAGAALFPPSTSMTSSLQLNYDERTASSANDDFETSASAWTAGANAQLDVTGEFRIASPTSTQRFWFAPPGGATADVWLVSPSLQVGAAALTVSFQHRYEFERDGATLYDGAVIELSSDDGQTWVDVGALATPGYVGVLTTTGQSTNPLAGRRAFAGRSDAYPAFHTETLNLGTTYANRAVRLRFRLGSDDARRLASKGWEIDDVRVTGLTNTPFPRLTVDPNRCSNTPPVAMVGAPLTVNEGERVVLTQTGVDAENDALSLTWTQSSGPLGVLTGNVFIAPEVTRDEALMLTLRAHDGRATSAPADLQVLVKNVNRLPQVTVPASRSVQPGDTVTLTATARDVDADPMTFTWTQFAGPRVTLAGAESLSVSFIAPASTEAQVVSLRFVASDGKDESSAGRVDVTIAAAPVPVEPEPEQPNGCGCSGGGDVLVALALLVSLRRFRSTPARR